MHHDNLFNVEIAVFVNNENKKEKINKQQPDHTTNNYFMVSLLLLTGQHPLHNI